LVTFPSWLSCPPSSHFFSPYHFFLVLPIEVGKTGPHRPTTPHGILLSLFPIGSFSCGVAFLQFFFLFPPPPPPFCLLFHFSSPLFNYGFAFSDLRTPDSVYYLVFTLYFYVRPVLCFFLFPFFPPLLIGTSPTPFFFFFGFFLDISQCARGGAA